MLSDNLHKMFPKLKYPLSKKLLDNSNTFPQKKLMKHHTKMCASELLINCIHKYIRIS